LRRRAVDDREPRQLGHRTATERRGVGRRGPQFLELVVEPGESQRTAGHVETGDNLPDLRQHRLDAVLLEQRTQRLPEHEQLLVLRRTPPVEDGRGPSRAAGARRSLGERRFQQHRGQFPGRNPSHRADSRFTVNTEAEVHVAWLHPEQRFGLPREGATVERHAKAERSSVGLARQRFHPVDVVTAVGGRAGDLKYHEVTDHPTAFRTLLRRCGGHVVRDEHRAAIDTLGAEPLLRDAEVQHITGVVAEAEQHPGAAVQCLTGPVGPVQWRVR
jgi:hypothetical protein